jgi:predicted O-methyltransferase YrrM
MINQYIETALTGSNDSDRHLMVLFSIALATKGKNFIELGVRSGTTTGPLKMAAQLNCGKLYSVDIDKNPFKSSKEDNWEYVQNDAIEFLENWEKNKNPSPDFIYVDDWHSYDHVKKELDILDRIVTPSSIIILHDAMYGNTCPYYHSDLTLKDGQWANGGPYRAISELNPQFWEFSTLPWSHGLTILRKKYSNRKTK